MSIDWRFIVSYLSHKLLSLGRILAIDYGKKRTGLAVTDPLRIIASPLKGLQTIDLDTYIEKYTQTESVDVFLVGYPQHHDGNRTNLCDDIDDLLKRLNEKYPRIEQVKIDESYSSAEARTLLALSQKKKKAKEKKENLDMFSALVILRRFLGHEY